MTTATVPRLACAIALLVLASARPLHAQLEIGTWVKQASNGEPAMTFTVAACCNGGRRLTWRIADDDAPEGLTIDTHLDGHDAPVMANGQPTGETMAITRVDPHHATTILKMNGRPFGTSTVTLSADGRTLTVVNDVTARIEGQELGKTTEVWRKQ